MSVEFVDAERQLPIAYRNTICNMMAEAESWNGIFAPDDVTYAWLAAKGMKSLPYPRIAPGADVAWAVDETLTLSDVRPMIAKPFSPGNAFPAEEVAKERLAFDKALIGSCTNGGYDDLLSAALVIRAARAQGLKKAAKEFVIFPGSGGVKQQIERPDARLDGESIAEVFRSVGGGIRQSWCGPCFGQGPDAPTRGPGRDPQCHPHRAEPDGRGRGGFPGGARGGGGERDARLQGPAVRARTRVGAGGVRGLTVRPSRSRRPACSRGAHRPVGSS